MENTYYNTENNATMNPMKIKVMKAKARQSLFGNYGKLIGANLLLAIILGIVNGILSPMISYNPGPIQYIIYYVASFIVTMLYTFFYTGIYHMHLNASRGKELNIAQLAFPVKNGSNRFLGVAFVLALISFIETIPSAFMMPKLNAIMYGDTDAILDAAMSIIGLSIASIVIAIVCLIIILGLSLAPFLLIDNPEMSAKEALAASFRYMKGNKLRLFLLELSFIGLALLGLLTLGLAYLWLIPYMEQTVAVFYETIVQPEQ